MRWPWKRAQVGSDRLAIQLTEHQLAWVVTHESGRVLRAGVEQRGGDDTAAFMRRIRALDLPTQGVTAVLALDEAMLLQIETPAVKPEEMKSAARWRIKDLVDARLDELTIDVMHVGDAAAQGVHRQMFVVAARNALIQTLSRRAQSAGLMLEVIDTAEMVQRNLQTAASQAQGLGERATAMLARHGAQALLTICADGELYYARRLDWDESGLVSIVPSVASVPDSLEGLDFVDYGAADAADLDGGAPRLVVELQRSFDVWERSWPDLPLSALWVAADASGDALLGPLTAALGFPVYTLDPQGLFPGLDDAAPGPALRSAAVPLVSALRRYTAPA